MGRGVTPCVRRRARASHAPAAGGRVHGTLPLAAAMVDGVHDYGKGSYLNCLWRLAESVVEPVSAAVASALRGGEGDCHAWRQVQWRLDSLWRSDQQAKKRARRRERRERAREEAAKEMQLIEQSWLENQAAPSVLGLCGRLLGGDEMEPEPCAGAEDGAEEGTPPMDAAIAERAAALTRESGQHGDGTGIALDGILYALEHILADRDQITAETTTSDLFKGHVLGVTMPPGWTKSWPEVTNTANSWYTHHYIEDSTGAERQKPDGSPDPPPGTYSLCARMKADPSTAHFIGRPTHFVSHAHTYKAQDLINALKNYESMLPPEQVGRVRYWIDGFSIDEHQGFYGDKGEDNSEQWANTFKEAVQKMGNTVMVLAPWDRPVVLTRMWCLWEMFCTVDTKSTFHISLGAAQEQALEAALVANGEALLDAFASIDVRTARAGPDDTALIMGAIEQLPGGVMGLNKLAMERMRSWAFEKVKQMVSARRDGTGRVSQVERELAELGQLGWFLFRLGETDAARQLYEEVIAGQTAQLGASHTSTLVSKANLAVLLSAMGETDVARTLLEEAVEGATSQLGAAHPFTTFAKSQLARLAT